MYLKFECLAINSICIYLEPWCSFIYWLQRCHRFLFCFVSIAMVLAHMLVAAVWPLLDRCFLGKHVWICGVSHKLRRNYVGQVDGAVAAMSDRRRLQNYENLPHYLTESQWEILKSGTHEKASSCLFLLCWNLGLRCPTEGTFSMLLNLMELAKGSQTRMSSFQRYSAFAQLKEN